MSLTKVQTEMAGTGSVLQVVNATYSAGTSTSSTSFISTGHSATITPKFANSKIAIFLNGGSSYWAVTTTRDLNVTIYRGATNLAGGTNSLERLYMSNAQEMLLPHSISYVDSPATTSATTYTVYFLSGNGQAVTYQFGSGTINLILMEIAG